EVGTVLARIDPGLYEARVDQTRAALDVAEANLRLKQARFTQAERDWDRAQKVLRTGISQEEFDAIRSRYDVTKADVEVSKAGIKQAQSALKEAEVNLGYTIIRSPVKGVVLDRRVNVGQTVTAGFNTPSLFLIARDLKRMQVWVSVPEADIGQVRTGQEA